MSRFTTPFILVLFGAATTGAPADERDKQKPRADNVVQFSLQARQQASAAIERSLSFLKATQKQDGGWEHAGQSDPAVTA